MYDFKKKGKPMDENYKSAKMSALSSLKDEMSKMMGDDVKGLKKVTVAAPDQEGLEKGLEKAEELVSSKDEQSEEVEESAPESEVALPEDPQEIDALIAQLEAKKAELLKASE